MPVSVSPELARAVRQLHEEGVSQREIARRLKLGHISVFRIVHGQWEPADEREDPHWREKLQARRCSGCGGMVYAWPCRLCSLRAHAERHAEPPVVCKAA